MDIKRKNGFTAMEAVVAIGVFSLAFIIISGAFVFLLRSQKADIRDARLIDSSRFAIETMARTLRTVNPASISSPAGNTSGVSSITFSTNTHGGSLGCPSSPCVITYSLSSGKLYERDGAMAPPGLPLTSSVVYVNSFTVKLFNRGKDQKQPKAVLILKLRPADSTIAPDLTLETSVSFRQLESVELAGSSPPPPVSNNWVAPGRLPNSNFVESSVNNEPCDGGRYDAFAYFAADGKQGDCFDARTNTDNPGWWYVNLGQVRHIERIVLYWDQPGYTFPLTVQGSNDCNSWNNIRAVSSSPSPVTIGSLNVDYSCVRLIGSAGSISMRIAEIEIWDR